MLGGFTANITQGEATFYAATIAAVMALVSIVINLSISYHTERRISHRKSLENAFNNIGNLIYQVVAMSNTISSKYKSHQDATNTINKVDLVRKKLDICRWEVRYSLWGLDEGFRQLVRLPSYVAQCKKFPKQSEEFIRRGTKIRSCLDRAIMTSYEMGRRPLYRHRVVLCYHCWRLKSSYDSFKKQDV